mmetsp:Transcript_17068/g.25841  ORF Transcript_17068/g.25841 Transcript_17068/m.25841 type:complete len:485 (-) Transcript_17068:57-1511(-)
MNRTMRGLPITTTSRPDLVPLIKRNLNERWRAGQPIPLEIVFGEFKNGPNYTSANCMAQDIGYLQGLLYYLRIEFGLKVNSVYGFCVSGRRCSDQTAYTISLVRLCAPESLGEVMNVEVCMLDAKSLEAMTPLRTLIHFLKFGKRWSIDTSTMEATGEEVEGTEVQLQDRKEASYFTLPTSLWGSNILVKNGTLAIIFQGTSKEISSLLSDRKHFDCFREDIEWKAFCESVKNYFCEQRDKEKKYYLKVPSKDECMHINPIQPMYDAWGTLEKHDFVLGLYPVRPFSKRDVGVILMNDCGSRLGSHDAYQSKSFEDTCRMFCRIIAVSECLMKILPHGDTLPHNIVYDKNENCFTLIDLDEGICVKRGSGFYLRENTYEDESDSNWLRAMYYPNCLRMHPNLYTMTQLVAPFVVLMRDKNVDCVDFEAIERTATDIGGALLRKDFDGNRITGKTIGYNEHKQFAKNITSLYENMKKFCKDFQDS